MSNQEIIAYLKELIDIADKIILLNSSKLEKVGTKEEVVPYISSVRCGMLKEGE